MTEILHSLMQEIERHPYRFIIMYNEEGSGGVFASGDQAKVAAGLVATLKSNPELKEWLEMVLKMASKK